MYDHKLETRGLLQVGDGFEAGVTIGPLINMAAVKKVEEHISDGLSRGARVVAGGKRHAMGRSFYEPTVIADATPEMLIFREETFGPVAPIFRFKTEEKPSASRTIPNLDWRLIFMVATSVVCGGSRKRWNMA